MSRSLSWMSGRKAKYRPGFKRPIKENAVSKKVAVKQIAGNEVPAEVLATAIVSISRGIKALRETRLNDKALYMLIAYAAPNVGGQRNAKPLGQRDVKAVIEGIESLEATYLKPIPEHFVTGTKAIEIRQGEPAAHRGMFLE